jgi:hypothetical protein
LFSLIIIFGKILIDYLGFFCLLKTQLKFVHLLIIFCDFYLVVVQKNLDIKSHTQLPHLSLFSNFSRCSFVTIFYGKALIELELKVLINYSEQLFDYLELNLM